MHVGRGCGTGIYAISGLRFVVVDEMLLQVKLTSFGCSTLKHNSVDV